MLRHLADEERNRGIERKYVSLDNAAQRAVAKEDPALFLQRFAPSVAAADGVPSGFVAFKREVGMGAVICMSDDVFPLADNVWAFPSWAI